MEGKTGHQESSGDSEGEDDSRHRELLFAIESLGRKRHRGSQQRSEAAATVSEHNLSLTGGEGGRVSVGELLSGLEGHREVGALRRRLTRGEGKKSKLLQPPLPKPQAERVHRAAAYQESSKHISKWIPIVKKNREAEHLSFPLQEEHLPLPSLTTRVETFKPTTELEFEVAAVLASSSEHVESNDQELTEAEKSALLRMSLEEARERRRELQRMRALMSYHEEKCRRAKKIKSKRYHRIQRRKREGHTVERAAEDVEKAERLRAKERMTLKHSNMAKWARQQLARGHRDPATQQALSEHHGTKQQLKQKRSMDSESSDSDGGGEAVEDEEDTPVLSTTSGNPWLSASGGSNKSAHRAVLILDHERPETAEEEEEEEEEYLPNDFEPEEVNRGGSDDEEKVETTPTSKGASLKDCTAKQIDTSAFLLAEGDEESGRVSLGMASEHLLNVQEAFAGDDVVEAFEREKEEEVEKGRPKEVEPTLPGWGVWGGEGVKPPRKRSRAIRPAEPKKQRKDAGLKHVIISEERNRKAAKHQVAHRQYKVRSQRWSRLFQVSSLPWPYTSREHFEKSHCTPIGRHWNSELTFHQLVRPKVTTKMGTIIEPIRLTEDVQDFMKRTEKKSRPQKGRKKKVSVIIV